MWGAWRVNGAGSAQWEAGATLAQGFAAPTRVDAPGKWRAPPLAARLRAAMPTCKGARQGVLIVKRARGASRVGWERSSTELECSTTQ